MFCGTSGSDACRIAASLFRRFAPYEAPQSSEASIDVLGEAEDSSPYRFAGCSVVGRGLRAINDRPYGFVGRSFVGRGSRAINDRPYGFDMIFGVCALIFCIIKFHLTSRPQTRSFFLKRFGGWGEFFLAGQEKRRKVLFGKAPSRGIKRYGVQISPSYLWPSFANRSK